MKFNYKHYLTYLNSAKWKEIASFFKTDKCEFCKSTNRLQTHHRNYKNLGKETAEDLVTLCDICHTAIHFSGGHKIKRWQSGSELYIKAAKQGWKIKGWKKQQKVNRFFKRSQSRLQGEDR